MRAAVALLAVLAGLTGAAALAGPAAAQNPARGAELAHRWCTPCHVVAPDESGGDAGPPFMAMRVGRTEPGLRAWLFQPHPPMPDLNLTADEIEAILAYIRTLPVPEETAPEEPATQD